MAHIRALSALPYDSQEDIVQGFLIAALVGCKEMT